MSSAHVQVVFVVLMILVGVTGYYCAAKLSKDYPWWIRGIVLYPALAALCTLAAMLRGHYVAYVQDIVLAVGIVLLYAVVASRFSDHPWLDMRVSRG